MSEQETIPVEHQTPRHTDGAASKHPAGLLQFYPLGTPPTMRFFPLKSDTTIGRSADNTIQITDDRASRVHARIVTDGLCWQLTDCDSTNGVFVDGQRTSVGLLRGGEIIRVGATLFSLLREGTAARTKKHKLYTSGLVGGPSLHRIRQLLDCAADSILPVLITGETGTGKELAARHLHHKGPRAKGPFVAFNCAALPAGMIESELFGHVKGAFTSATIDSVGLVAKAHGGTLFFDEIGELPTASQAKLLRALQTKEVRPVGGTEAKTVDVRIVCATNRDLPATVQNGTFRNDLYARIATLVVRLPRLDQRREDVPLLAHHFCKQHAQRDCKLSIEAVEHLSLRQWPFNARELESTIQRALLLSGDCTQLTLDHVRDPLEGNAHHLGSNGDALAPQATPPGAPSSSQSPADQQTQRRAKELCAALRRNAGDPHQAAEELGISRSQLYRRAKQFGINVGAFR